MRFTKTVRRRMKGVLILGLWGACVSWAAASDEPPAEAFRVLAPAAKEAPAITPYLEYQTEMAWRQDDERRKEWRGIGTEQDLQAVQRRMEENLLAMLGGLPSKKNPSASPHHGEGSDGWVSNREADF
ncbi:MAG: hypothetical protein ABR921_01680 [Candidatus Sulfotelmatobacter sp.]